MNPRSTILIVSSFFPYPAFFGGAFDILERIKGFHQLNFDIHLVYTSKSKPSKEEVSYMSRFVDKMTFVPRKNTLFKMLSKNPLQVESRDMLRKAKLKPYYDFVLLESESVGSILKNKKLNGGKFILRIHNNESDYFNELYKSSKSIFKKIYFKIESIKFRAYAPKIHQSMDRLWFISHKELSAYNGSNGVHMFPPINEEAITNTNTSKNVLFVGSLYMDNNLQAIIWFLKKVHQKILALHPDYKLIICGSIGDLHPDYFNKLFSGYSNINVHFNVKDLREYYRSSLIFINPMFHGSGVKLKSINALVNGLVLISTKVGSEGVGLVDKDMFFLANTPEEFKQVIDKVFKGQYDLNMVQRAQDYIESKHYLNTIKSEMLVLNGQ